MISSYSFEVEMMIIVLGLSETTSIVTRVGLFTFIPL